jgi:hypothetical protein
MFYAKDHIAEVVVLEIKHVALVAHQGIVQIVIGDLASVGVPQCQMECL